LIEIKLSLEIRTDKRPEREAAVSQGLGQHRPDKILRLRAKEQAGGAGRAAPEIARFNAKIGVEFPDRQDRG
jgi:hypothetical protein